MLQSQLLTPKEFLSGAYHTTASFRWTPHRAGCAHLLRSSQLQLHCRYPRICRRLICNAVGMALNADLSKDVPEAQAQVLTVSSATLHIDTPSASIVVGHKAPVACTVGRSHCIVAVWTVLQIRVQEPFRLADTGCSSHYCGLSILQTSQGYPTDRAC